MLVSAGAWGYREITCTTRCRKGNLGRSRHGGPVRAPHGRGRSIPVPADAVSGQSIHALIEETVCLERPSGGAPCSARVRRQLEPKRHRPDRHEVELSGYQLHVGSGHRLLSGWQVEPFPSNRVCIQTERSRPTCPGKRVFSAPRWPTRPASSGRSGPMLTFYAATVVAGRPLTTGLDRAGARSGYRGVGALRPCDVRPCAPGHPNTDSWYPRWGSNPRPAT